VFLGELFPVAMAQEGMVQLELEQRLLAMGLEVLELDQEVLDLVVMVAMDLVAKL